MSGIEAIASLCGLICVWLTVRQNIWCWPVGLVMVTLYAWIFYHVRLYSDMGLQVIYIGLQIYGWAHWLRGGPREAQLPITRLGRRECLFWMGVGGVGTAVLGSGMASWTDAALPFGDAATTVLSLIAQFLLARKVLESWPFWIAMDGLAIGIYAAKALYITAGLYAMFLVLASWGWIEWKQSLRRQELEAALV